MAKDKTKPKATKATKATTPEAYNASKAGKSWNYSDLPSHLASLRKRPTLFANAIRAFQKANGLLADSKLGPKTLKTIRAVFSSAPPATEASKDSAEGDKSDDAGDD